MHLREYDKEQLEQLCQDSYSYAEVLRKMGYKPGGNQQHRLKLKIKEFNIDVSHFTGERWQWSPNQKDNIQSIEKYILDEIFIKNSPASRKVINGYIKRHNLLKYECANCGCNGQWQGGEISLELDHIDGDNTNNELSNLRYLCPNCHALTETYRGKNKHLKSLK